MYQEPLRVMRRTANRRYDCCEKHQHRHHHWRGWQVHPSCFIFSGYTGIFLPRVPHCRKECYFSRSIDVSMEETSSELEEVIVSGLASTVKRSMQRMQLLKSMQKSSPALPRSQLLMERCEKISRGADHAKFRCSRWRYQHPHAGLTSINAPGSRSLSSMELCW